METWYLELHRASKAILICIFYMSPQWICVPFVLMNPNTLNIGQTLMNNTLHAPWIGEMELKKTWIMIDEFLFFVRKQQYG